MRIAVVSDTHGQVENTRRAADTIAERSIGAVLHCGDIGSPAIVRLFDRWPAHFVFGNVDHDTQELEDAICAAGQSCHGRFGALDLDGIRVALIHSDDGPLFRQTIASGDYDLVCYGHTHQADAQRHGKTLALNPGALYRAQRHSFAIVELPSLEVEFVWL